MILKVKQCPKCLQTLKATEFNWKVKDVKLASYCKNCSRAYIRDHYARNREYYLNKAHRRNLNIRQEAFEYIGSYLYNHPCVDCGETDISVLEFDHKRRTGKEYNVSRIIRMTGSIKKLKCEISKCEVRCANCHRRKTARENSSWKLSYAPVA